MPQWVLVLLGVGATALVAFLAWIVTSINSLRVDVESNKRQFALIPLAQLIQDQFLKSLHHEGPGFEEPDRLIDEWFGLTISPEGVDKLKAFMAHRMIDPAVSEEERLRAEAVLALMKIVVIQKRTAAEMVATKALSLMIGLSVASIQAMRYWR